MRSHKEFTYKGYQVVAKAARLLDDADSGFVGSFVVQQGAAVCWRRSTSTIHRTAAAALDEALSIAKASIQQELRRRWVERMRTLPGSAFELSTTGY